MNDAPCSSPLPSLGVRRAIRFLIRRSAACQQTSTELSIDIGVSQHCYLTCLQLDQQVRHAHIHWFTLFIECSVVTIHFDRSCGYLGHLVSELWFRITMKDKSSVFIETNPNQSAVGKKIYDSAKTSFKYHQLHKKNQNGLFAWEMPSCNIAAIAIPVILKCNSNVNKETSITAQHHQVRFPS